MLDDLRHGRNFGRLLPAIATAKTYQRQWLRDDLLSGVVAGAIMVPVAMAYAQMAGVPPQAGLYAAILGMALWSLFSTSRHIRVTTSSTMSIMSLAVVTPLAAGDPTAFMALSSALALTVGILMVILSFMKLGFIADFLARSVMTGYIFGVACLIAISQLPKVFGVTGGSGSFFQQLAQFIAKLPETNRYDLALGVGTMALILWIARTRPRIPGALVALAVGIVISSLFQLNALHGVKIVGDIPTGLPSPALPAIDPHALPFLIGGAMGIVFLAVSETLGTGRAYAAKYHYEIDADQELLALGMANVGAGFFQGITVDLSLSNTASAEAAGQRTQLATLVSAGIILAVAVVLAPLLRNVPSAVLGAIVLTSILGLFNFKAFQRYWRERKTDFVLALTALVGVTTTDVMTGLAVAVVLSLLMVLYRASRPYIALLGRRPSGEFGDLARHLNAQPIPGVVIMRLDAPLYFFNANVARTQILAQAGRDPAPRAIVLDLGASADLDIGTVDMLRALVDDLRRANVDLRFAQVRSSVKERMRITGLLDFIGEDHLFPSIGAAVQSLGEPPAAAPAPPAGVSPAA